MSNAKIQNSNESQMAKSTLNSLLPPFSKGGGDLTFELWI